MPDPANPQPTAAPTDTFTRAQIVVWLRAEADACDLDADVFYRDGAEGLGTAARNQANALSNAADRLERGEGP